MCLSKTANQMIIRQRAEAGKCEFAVDNSHVSGNLTLINFLGGSHYG